MSTACFEPGSTGDPGCERRGGRGEPSGAGARPATAAARDGVVGEADLSDRQAGAASSDRPLPAGVALDDDPRLAEAFEPGLKRRRHGRFRFGLGTRLRLRKPRRRRQRPMLDREGRRLTGGPRSCSATLVFSRQSQNGRSGRSTVNRGMARCFSGGHSASSSVRLRVVFAGTCFGALRAALSAARRGDQPANSCTFPSNHSRAFGIG